MLKIFGSLIDKELQDPFKDTFKWSGFQFMLFFTQMTMCYFCAIFGKQFWSVLIFHVFHLNDCEISIQIFKSSLIMDSRSC